MKKILITLFIFFISQAIANDDMDFKKHLQNEIYAIVKTKKLYDAGEYTKASILSSKGLIKYPNEISLLQLRAKSYYALNNLEKARIDFLKVLQLEPSNNEAQEGISKIEAQEKAKVNKNSESISDFIQNKGFSFLMIFLGFLGSQIIAKKYSFCNMHSEKNQINYFISEKNNFLITFKIFFKNIFSICNLLSLLIFITIIFTLTVVIISIILAALYFNDSLLLITSNEIGTYIKSSILLSIIIYLISRYNSIRNIVITEMDVAILLQKQSLNDNFKDLKDSIDILEKHKAGTTLELLKYCTNDVAINIIRKTLLLIKK